MDKLGDVDGGGSERGDDDDMLSDISLSTDKMQHDAFVRVSSEDN